jgi:hypothetical protein
MPVRFQVDPDFYDHPKTIGMSDSATALWVRAGSYSVAKLLDGFVPEDVLSLLSTVSAEAASELVGRGLWRRVKGGFRFHQWDARNLTRARVEADRDYDRERKRRVRQLARQNGNSQVDGQIVRTGHPPESGPDSERNPNRSVSVSVSESVSNPPTPRRGKSAPPTDDDPHWSAFWAAYPRKVGKGQARKAWPKATKAADPADIIAGANHYAEQRRGQEPQYTAHPATWLNGERWTDQPPPPRNDEGWWNN